MALRGVRRPGHRLRRPAGRARGGAACAVRSARRAVLRRDAVLAGRGRATATACGRPYWYDSVWRSTGFVAARSVAARPRSTPRSSRCSTSACRTTRAPKIRSKSLSRTTAADSRSPPMLQQFDERNRDLIVNVGGKLAHRDEAGVSPFDSVGAGRGRGVGGAAADQRPDLRARRAPGAAAPLGARARVFLDPGGRGDHRGDPPDPRGQRNAATASTFGSTLTRGVKITSGMDPRLNVRADADRAGRVQGPGLRPVRDPADHVERAAARAGLPGPQDPPQQPAAVHPRQDRGQRRRRGRRGHARPPRFHRRDQRDAHLHGRLRGRCRRRRRRPARRGSPARRCCRLAAGAGFGDRGRRLHAPAALQRRRGLRHRHDGRPRAGRRRGRPGDRRRRRRPGHQAPHRALHQPHRHHRHRRASRPPRSCRPPGAALYRRCRSALGRGWRPGP